MFQVGMRDGSGFTIGHSVYRHRVYRYDFASTVLDPKNLVWCYRAYFPWMLMISMIFRVKLIVAATGQRRFVNPNPKAVAALANSKGAFLKFPSRATRKG